MVALLSVKIAKAFQNKTNIQVLPLEAYNKLDLPVNTHADMLICVIENKIFCYREYYESNKEIFSTIQGDYEIIPINEMCAREYPRDVYLNILIVGKKLFCNIKHASKEIVEFAKKNNYKIINVKQGYSACSSLVLDSEHVITTDKGIYNALIQENISTLLVSTKNIILEGYNCGFIGGSGGASGKKVYFFGDITHHCDFNKINEYLKSNNFEFISILSGEVCDFGGIKFI